MQREVFMPRGPYWEPGELERLKTCYKTASRAELLELFPGRSFMGISEKAGNLGLKRNGSVAFREQRKPFRRELTGPELAYIAGIVDGEGHIGFTRKRNDRWLYYAPGVGVTNQSEALIRWMDDRINWSIRCLNPDNSGYTWVYRPAIIGHAVAPLLRALRPYLVIKGAQADLMIEYCDSRANAPGHTPYTPEQVAMVERVYELNKKRSRPEPTSALLLSPRSA
jgi:hypothetical protein